MSSFTRFLGERDHTTVSLSLPELERFTYEFSLRIARPPKTSLTGWNNREVDKRIEIPQFTRRFPSRCRCRRSCLKSLLSAQNIDHVKQPYLPVLCINITTE